MQDIQDVSFEAQCAYLQRHLSHITRDEQIHLLCRVVDAGYKSMIAVVGDSLAIDLVALPPALVRSLYDELVARIAGLLI